MKSGRKQNNKGAALLVVLFVVMAVTVLSLGFLSRSDIELACGKNVLLKSQTDYLAESGLEYARARILTPQDVNSGYWPGATGCQLVGGSDDYFDITVVQTGTYDYTITCEAYRLQDSVKIGRSGLAAELRLDPCIAIRTGEWWTTEPTTTVIGDIYCKGNLAGTGYLEGDGFADGQISATNLVGRENQYISEEPVISPDLDIFDLNLTYNIGSNTYSATLISDSEINDVTLGPTGGNPAGVYYCDNNLEIADNVVINGTLVVEWDLEVTGTGNSIIAQQKFPAVVVKQTLRMTGNAQLHIEGLALIKHKIEGDFMSSLNLTITGALFIELSNIDNFDSFNDHLTIVSDPLKASIEVWPNPGVSYRWSPVGGAFFKSIARTQ